MLRHVYLTALIVGLLLFSACQNSEDGEVAERSVNRAGSPNIIVVVVDDLRWDELGVAGHPFLETPHIDALARDGVVFRQHFAQATHTPPSMSTIFFARFFAPRLTMSTPNVSLTTPNELFRAREPTAISIPEVFKEAGWANGAISAHPWLPKRSRFGALFDESQRTIPYFSWLV